MPMRIEGTALPIMISVGRSGRHEQLIERALFSFARDGQSGQHQNLQHAERRDQARDHVPARFEIRVVPGARFDRERRARTPCALLQAALKRSTTAPT